MNLALTYDHRSGRGPRVVGSGMWLEWSELLPSQAGLAWLQALRISGLPFCRASRAVFAFAESLVTRESQPPAAPCHWPPTRRLIDGREAVTFLKRIKEIVEDPRRLLLDV